MVPRFARASIATLATILVSSTAGSELCKGETEILRVFDSSNGLIPSPEGIAFDNDGNSYISLREFDGRVFKKNQILKLDTTGDFSTITDFGPALLGSSGLLGLATDPDNNVYAAFSSNDENHGVWKIDPVGEKTRLPGSEKITVPNALTFDSRGNLYATDSFPASADGPGVIWKFSPPSDVFKIWASDPLLAPDPKNNPLSPPRPAPPVVAPGANGIVFVPPRSIYVANTEKSLILHIKIGPNGNAGKVKIVAGAYPLVGPPSQLFSPDGLAADLEGNLYTVNPPAGWTAIPHSSVIKIYPSSGTIESLTKVRTEPPPDFDFPTSLAFGTLGTDRNHLFVVGIGGARYGLRGSGAKLTKVGAGASNSPPE